MRSGRAAATLVGRSTAGATLLRLLLLLTWCQPPVGRLMTALAAACCWLAVRVAGAGTVQVESLVVACCLVGDAWVLVVVVLEAQVMVEECLEVLQLVGAVGGAVVMVQRAEASAMKLTAGRAVAWMTLVMACHVGPVEVVCWAVVMEALPARQQAPMQQVYQAVLVKAVMGAERMALLGLMASQWVVVMGASWAAVRQAANVLEAASQALQLAGVLQALQLAGVLEAASQALQLAGVLQAASQALQLAGVFQAASQALQLAEVLQAASQALQLAGVLQQAASWAAVRRAANVLEAASQALQLAGVLQAASPAYWQSVMQQLAASRALRQALAMTVHTQAKVLALSPRGCKYHLL
jgi:hypothetical protein